MRAGKIRYLGASNFSGWHLMKALVDRRARGHASASSASRSTIRCRRARPSTSSSPSPSTRVSASWSGARSPAASSPASTAATGSGPEGSRHLNQWNEPPIYDEAKLWDIVDVLVDIGEGRGIPPAQVALAWLLGRPAVTSLVVGARTEEQLAANLGCIEVALTADERSRLDVVSAPTLIYPYWHQAWTAHDRLSAADLTLLAPYIAARAGGASPK